MVASLWSHGIQLIKEDHTRACIPGSLEDPTDICLGLSDVHVQQLRALDREEVEGTGRSDGFGDKSLSRSGRAVQQNTCAMVSYNSRKTGGG